MQVNASIHLQKKKKSGKHNKKIKICGEDISKTDYKREREGQRGEESKYKEKEQRENEDIGSSEHTRKREKTETLETAKIKENSKDNERKRI